MVITFESIADRVSKISEHASMSTASAALPQGAYTTFRTYDGTRLLRLAQHLRRLEESVGLMLGQPAPAIDDARAAASIRAVLSATGFSDTRFRLTYAPPSLYISVEAFVPYGADLYQNGVHCATVSLSRANPHAKSTTFIASAADAYKALPAGIHEGLMLADDGTVLEGLSSNFFAVTPLQVRSEDLDDDVVPVLRSEEDRVLIGVTRTLVLEVAKPVVTFSKVAVRFADLARVSECFITSVSREIMPVVKIDAQTIGDGVPGPITRELMRGFAELIAREAVAP
jgi:branched-chain amino acid aminotransferase